MRRRVGGGEREVPREVERGEVAAEGERDEIEPEEQDQQAPEEDRF